MNKYIFFLILNIFILPQAIGETIDLRCAGDATFKNQNGSVQPLRVEYNLTIISNTPKTGKILINDRDQNETHEFGSKRVTAFSINKSEIDFTTEYKSPARTMPNGVIQTEGTEKRIYNLSRTTGLLTQTTFSQGGLAKVLDDEGVKVLKLNCDKRNANKF
jgi:hypothetical protein